MSDEIGKIEVKKVPASQAKPGNAKHARLMAEQAKAERKNGPGIWAAKVKTDAVGPALFGLLVIILFVVGFFAWAARAPLSGATLAAGVLTASGQNFNVQHLEGGIVNQIMVKEGEGVVKGQALLSLDPTRVQSERDRLSKGLLVMRAQASRLEAERDGVDLVFQPELVTAACAAGLQGELAEQRNEHQKRLQRFHADRKIIVQQIEALEQQIQGTDVQIVSTKEQIEVIREELEVKQKLVDKKLIRRSELLQIMRTRSQLEGRLGELISNIGETKSTISQALERKLRLRAAAAETAAASLNELRQKMTDVEERIVSAESVLRRIVVRAPSDGVVVKIHKTRLEVLCARVRICL